MTSGRAVRARSVSHSAVISARSATVGGGPLLRHEIVPVELRQGRGDPLELREHAAALRLGRVRREHELDAEVPQQRGHLVAGDAAPPERGDRLADGLADRLRRLLPGPPPELLDPMDLLGQVDEVEVEGEGGGDRRGPWRAAGTRRPARAWRRQRCRPRGAPSRGRGSAPRPRAGPATPARPAPRPGGCPGDGSRPTASGSCRLSMIAPLETRAERAPLRGLVASRRHLPPVATSPQGAAGGRRRDDRHRRRS